MNSMSNQIGSGGVDGGGANIPKGINLSNTVHSEVATSLPLPSLPVFCGAVDQELKLFDEQSGGSSRSLSRSEAAKQASKISDLLSNTDVSYLNFKAKETPTYHGSAGQMDLYEEVLRRNAEAFEYACPRKEGPVKESRSNSKPADTKAAEKTPPVKKRSERNTPEIKHHEPDTSLTTEPESSSKKRKLKKKGNNDVSSIAPDLKEHQDALVKDFCEILEEFCNRAEIIDDERDETEWSQLSVSDLKSVVNEVISMREKKLLHLIPVDILERSLKVLDHHIHRAEGLSIIDSENSDADVASTIFGALESIHAALAIMAYTSMPKQIYKEEMIDRIIEFSRHQIADVMSACDPAFRAMHKPIENGAIDAEDDEEGDSDYGSASKKRRTTKSGKPRKLMTNRVSSKVNNILQKLCTILGLVKDLLSIERLSDSCILQLVRTSFTMFLVDNVQLLQLKALSLISGVYYTYNQHRAYVMDELLHVLLKIPLSKRVARTYHLPDEEQRQIQLTSALLIQLVQYSADLPELLRQPLDNSSLELSVEAVNPTKCHESVTESCCLFWSRVLQRFTNMKSQEANELKSMMENLVLDLLTTLNLPEYPASALLLEVLCVLLMQNAGLKSKDVAARSMSIDLLGTIAARLKHDAVVCKQEQFWIVKELLNEESIDYSQISDTCSVCLDAKTEKTLLLCQVCQRLYHVECIGVKEHEVSDRNFSCHICVCKKQLLGLKSHCESKGKKKKASANNETIPKPEIVQQMLLNYLQDTGSADDLHIFTRWFNLCMWYKDDPDSEQKYYYYLARLKAKEILRETGDSTSYLTRASVKKINLAIGQDSSFTRGFDKILQLLLASLRENSPVIRAKALKAVSIIVEADPEVLCDSLVQTAVEGRFCDSAISVREAALELVGRHIASHPDVGLKYFGKVAERTKDTGVSVRKRAIRIIKDMCTSNASFAESTTACIEIISRVSDDESSIQDLVCKTFYEFWFEDSPNPQSHVFGDGSSVPLDVVKKTEQIVGMLRRMPGHQLLVTVIKRNLALDFLPQSAKAVGINPVSLASVRRRCELICKCLLEKILEVVEMNNAESEVRMLPYILLLHAFCVVDPTLCTPASDPSQFVVTLQPYLKSQADTRVVAQLLESIIFIIYSVLPFLRKLPHSVADELEQDLKHMIVRHPFLTVVHACIKCLCSVSRVAGKGGTVVEYLITLFYKHLESLGFDSKQQVGRSLFCLGLLIRYGTSLTSTSSSTNKNIDITSSLNLFKKYLQADEFVIKVRALQALGHVLIARPEFMLEKDIGKILEATLSSTSDVRLKMQSLQNMYEYLVDAESQMEAEMANKDEVNVSISGGNSVPVAAGAGDTNICGGIVQLFWDSILNRCLDVNELVRQSALKILEVVLRQGLVHPITCVPYLVALETDPLETNSKLAHHLLMNMNEKYPAFIENRLGDGLQMSFIFIQSMNNQNPNEDIYKTPTKETSITKEKSDTNSTSYARHGVSRIYKLIRTNRASRNKFITSVVRKFDLPARNGSTIQFLTYCTEILALLPFALPDEPLYLIYTINRVIQVRAGMLEVDLKALLQYLQGDEQKSNGNGVTSNNDSVMIDMNLKAEEEVTAQPVIEEKDQSSDGKVDVISERLNGLSQDVLQKVQANFLAAAAIQLLLKLKRHLKVVYSLNDARCEAFAPNEPPKPGEVLTRQSIPFSIGEMSVDPPSTYEDFLQRYQEFKNVLKEDTMDYSLYTSNIKRKRPPPPPSAKKPVVKITPRKVTAAASGGGRKSSGGNNSDDDDDDDEADEDWGDGVNTTTTSQTISGGNGRRSSSRFKQQKPSEM